MNQKVATGIPAVQPFDPTLHQPAAGDFSTKLFYCCCSEMSLWCMTCWCPCITFGRIAEIVDKGSPSCLVSGGLFYLIMSFTGCHWVYSCTYRSKIRAQYGMKQNDCGDCLAHFCCQTCALRQEYRELQHRGLDPGLGWQGNIIKQGQNQELFVPPAVQNGMFR